MINKDIINYLNVEPIFRNDIFYWFLFHGTRKYALECSKEEREAIHQACKVISKFADVTINSNQVPDEIQHMYHMYPIALKGKEEGDSFFQYGDFYLTTDFEVAIDYSANCGGEYMQLVYNNINGIIAAGIALPDEVKKAFDYIKDVYPKFEQSERIVVAINNIEYKDLLHQGGEKFFFSDNSNPFLNFYGNNGFRLMNVDKYKNRFYIINESDFDEYKAAFEKFAEMMELFENNKFNRLK